MALIDRKISTYAKDVSNLSDTPNDDGITAAELKAVFMGAAKEEIKTSVNGIVDDLVATTDGASGADQIGMTAVSGLDGTTPQAIVESLNSKVVKTTGDQTIEDVKTFSDSPTVPEPTTDYQAANKKYVEDEFTDRKLSDSGDFTGTLNGMEIVEADPGLSAEIVDARGESETLGIRLNGNDIKFADISEKQNWIDVRDYNCVCDGITDDSAAFQNAMNALNTLVTPEGRWKRVIYIPSKMRITQKISVSFGSFCIHGNSVTNSEIIFDGENAGLEIGNGTTKIFDIELNDIYLKGNDVSVCLLTIRKANNVYFNRVHVSNWISGGYGIKFYNSGIIFFDKCTIEGGSDMATNTANRNGIYFDTIGSIMNFINGNVWNLNTFITCENTIQNINIHDNWIECVREVIHFICIDEMRFLNLKIKNNTVNIHNISGIVYTAFGFVTFNSTATTNFYGSNFDISDNTLYFWDITGLTGNSLVYIPAMLDNSGIVISFDNNVLSGKTLTDLSAYLFYSASANMADDVFIMSCDLPRRADYTRITNYSISIRGLILRNDYKSAFPNGLCLSSSQSANTGNIYYSDENEDFYAGYAGTLKPMPKPSGVALSDSTASEVNTLKTDFNNLLSALRNAKIIG